ncbi:CRISPR-associated endonuclease Cas2 [Candidatus Parcubacteria bacterium]|nr:CRISPR-associated endonuclease Cas2 [Candidatus Parcubacteria bacterium]
MYIVIVYDVEQKRVNKICQFLRQYLNWVQNSVFEGEISEGQFWKIKARINKLIDKNKDSVLIYKTRSQKWLEKEVIGIEKNFTSNLI